MRLIRLIRKLMDLLFSSACERYRQQVRNEAWPYDDKRFSDHAVRRVYSGMNIRKQGDSGVWVVHSKTRQAPYLFFCSLLTTQKTIIRETARAWVTRLPLVEGKCYLKLVEYKYPFPSKPRAALSSEVLFASIRIETYGRIYSDFKLDFYI